MIRTSLWILLSASLLAAGGCERLETPKGAERYRIKFQRVPCGNSFCIRNDPEVEARRRSLERIQRQQSDRAHRAAPHSPLLKRERPANAHSAPNKPAVRPPSVPAKQVQPEDSSLEARKAAIREQAERLRDAVNRRQKERSTRALPDERHGDDDDDDEAIADASTGRGTSFGGLFSMPRLKYQPENRMLLEAYPADQPPTEEVIVEVSRGDLAIENPRCVHNSGKAEVRKIDSSHTAIRYTPHAGQRGSLMDWIEFKSNVNEMPIRLPVRGWAGDEAVFQPGWWDMPTEIAGVNRRIMRVTVKFKSGEVPKYIGSYSIPEKIAKVVQLEDPRPQTATFEIEMNDLRFPEGLFDVQVLFRFEGFKKEIVWRAMGYGKEKSRPNEAPGKEFAR